MFTILRALNEGNGGTVIYFSQWQSVSPEFFPQ